MVNTRPSVRLTDQFSMVETANVLGVDRKTIYRWRKCGYLKTKHCRHGNREYILGSEILKIYDVCK